MTPESTGSRSLHDRVVIGVAERVLLPEWGLGPVRAKIDTGARTSALHVENILPLHDQVVAFDVVLGTRKRRKTVRVEAPITRQSPVRSSNGKSELRYFVSTTVDLAGVCWAVEMSLTGRGDMRYRMLLGRSALGGGFLVDPGRRYVATPRSDASKPLASASPADKG